ncbi:MAG: hypothetical protein GAK28_03905 [Luteibacter sp.]|uniref:hypothetical protein n=1 Tax=Luteibacter sp. TaxID=1886636 RepID=UPI001381FFAA|nr:hypothetical protein [Luteibacter sp.]KAF1004528.1 MAG: hypothetical protein GAK28_03905 [Luteibacter sp.]
MPSTPLSRMIATQSKWLFLCLPLSLTGCATNTSLDPIPGPLMIKTVDALGVHSSSELTFDSLESTAPGSIRPQTLTYRTTIKRDGRTFTCSDLKIPGMAGDETIYTPPKCVPVDTSKP